MKSSLIVLILLIFSLQAFGATSKGQFYFNNENINALVGLICVGEESIATIQTGGGIEDERLSVSQWKIINYGDEIVVEGKCNAGVSKDGSFYQLDEGLKLEMKFYPNEISEASGDSIAKGTVGNAEVQILFSTYLDVSNGQVVNKTIVKNLSIAPGIGGARAGIIGRVFDSILPDLFRVNSRNSNMNFCNSTARQCRKTTWKTPQNKDLFYKAFGAGWLMNFGVGQIDKHLYFNAATVLDMTGTYRVPTFRCADNKACGATVLLGASQSSVSACSKYNERASKHMTALLCKSIIERIY